MKKQKPKAPSKPRPKVCGRPPKLTKDQVLAIREWDAIRQAMPCIDEMARAYGVHKTTILRVLAGDYMHHVT